MTDNGKNQRRINAQQAANAPAGGVATKIDALYSWLAYDLQVLKKDLCSELKYTAMQSSSVFKAIEKSTGAAAEENKKTVQLMAQEMKYGYKQNQAIYDGLNKILTDEVIVKLDTVEGKLALLEELDKAIAAIGEKVNSFDQAAFADNVRDGVLAALPQSDEVDYDKIGEVVAEKAEASVSEHSRQVLEAIAALPEAENVDYSRIVDEVGDKMLEVLQEVHNASVAASAEEKPVAVEIDYDRIVYGAAEKVVESLPYTEKLDYRRMDENFLKAATTLKAPEINTDDIVAKVLEGLDMDALATAIASKVEPAPAPEIDYERLSDMIIAKMPAPVQPEPVDYDAVANIVAEKLAAKENECDVLIDEEGVNEIAAGVAERLDIEKIADMVADRLAPEPAAASAVEEEETVDYDRISTIVEDKLSAWEEESSYEIVIDEEHLQTIAEKVAEILRGELCVAPCEEAVEETVEEVVEEPAPVEEVVEEPVEEVVEEVVEEPAPVEEPATEEIAVAVAEENFEEIDNQLVDAETGLVIRLKKSFTAKMKQSGDEVKVYYSRIKNALLLYKRVNSNVSWHGDRYNFGRDTIAKMNICGKTLCLYLALDPEDPEFKTTVYHQKNVGEQRAYESTPFMVKIKSDAASKKAVRLIETLAERLVAEKKENFDEVDYVEEFAYDTTKNLLAEGLIKISKEKKTPFNF